jgi:hypothetical protein
MPSPVNPSRAVSARATRPTRFGHGLPTEPRMKEVVRNRCFGQTVSENGS